ncbi:hypothetical protein SRHO_G00251730 [Serrasalmus rhombeus]
MRARTQSRLASCEARRGAVKICPRLRMRPRMRRALCGFPPAPSLLLHHQFQPDYAVKCYEGNKRLCEAFFWNFLSSGNNITVKSGKGVCDSAQPFLMN